MNFDNIPDELKFLNQWICWKTELNDQGKPTKVPYKSKGTRKASTTDPETWGTFRNAVRRITEIGDYDGIGFVFTENDPYIGIDFDDISQGDPHNLRDFIEKSGTYVEWSPGGDGNHLIGRAKVPGPTGRHPKGLGVFDTGRYFTFTGNVLDGEIRPIKDIQALIDERWPTWFPENEQAPPAELPDTPWFASDEDVVHKLRSAKNGAKFEELFNGDISGYPSSSEADLALCSLIVFYTQDRDQIARIMGHSALGQREKWKRSSYREATINRALQRSEFYQPTNSEEGVTLVITRGESGIEKTTPVFNTTDLGNSLRLTHHYGDSIRYNHTLGSWMIWDGTRWSEDRDGGIFRIVVNTVRTIYDEVEAVSSDDLRKALKAHAVKSETEGRMSAAEKVARNHDGVYTTLEKYDTDPYLFNVLNGTINLRDGSFRPHNRGDLITRIAPMEFNDKADCPHWLRFLDTVFAGDEDLISFVQRAIGYSMTGDVSERALFILYGSGRNGKSTLTETITRIMGDFSAISSSEMITAKRDNPMATDLARLLGVRFTAMAETGEYSRLDEAKVKMITGGDRIVAEKKYKDPFEFDPEFKVWLSTNHQPHIRGVDEGIWDRIRLIPFTVRIPDDKVDRYLKNKLLREASGILNWMIAGAVAWGEQGLKSNSLVVQATTEYRATMDTVGAFIAESLIPDSLGYISLAKMYQLYVEWAKDSGEHPVTKRNLSARMRDRGFIVDGKGAKNVVSVMGLREPFPSESGQVVRIKNY